MPFRPFYPDHIASFVSISDKAPGLLVCGYPNKNENTGNFLFIPKCNRYIKTIDHPRRHVAPDDFPQL